jgi:hypothetical protein
MEEESSSWTECLAIDFFSAVVVNVAKDAVLSRAPWSTDIAVEVFESAKYGDDVAGRKATKCDVVNATL